MLTPKVMQRGDTLIEVLFAVAIFSLIAVSSLALMNQGIMASQRALEVSLVRQEIDNQAETLRFLQAAYTDEFSASATLVTPQAQEFQRILTRIGNNNSASALGSRPCDDPPDRSFVLNTRKATAMVTDAVFGKPANYAQVEYNGANDIANTGSKGLWIEGVRSSGGSTTYIDFHIRACWNTPNSTIPMNIGTIVRLYVPTN